MAKKLALLVGVSEYDEQTFKPLPAATNDVIAVKQVLIHPGMGGFAEADVAVLTNASRQEIEEAIYTLFAKRQKGDLLLFYFSGHGVKDEKGKLYLATRNTRKDQGALFKPSAVAATILHDSMNESKSERQIIILDCCFSGAIAQGLTVKDDGTVDIQAQLGGKGRAILTSSNSVQYSFEQEDSDLSIYTRYLVEGIEKGTADQDEDGWISVDELHNYASSKVQQASPAMTPQFYPVQEGYRIKLAKAPVNDPKLKYRKEVKQRANHGNFTVPARRLLNSLQTQLGLSPAEATAIEDEVLEPYREFQRKLREYEETLRESIAAENPLSARTRQDLQDYQQHLGLRDKDIAFIRDQILGTQPETVPPTQTDNTSSTTTLPANQQQPTALTKIREIPHPSTGWGWIAGQKRNALESKLTTG
jgi:uncharacterized caspase-like protein